MEEDVSDLEDYSTREMNTSEIAQVTGDNHALGNLGAYRLKDVLGTGSTSIVYRAVGHDGHEVALKVLVDNQSKSNIDLERFIRESNANTHLSTHANIISILASGNEGEYYYLAMEIVPDGLTLKKVLQEQSLSVQQKLEIVQPFIHKTIDILRVTVNQLS